MDGSARRHSPKPTTRRMAHFPASPIHGGIARVEGMPVHPTAPPPHAPNDKNTSLSRTEFGVGAQFIAPSSPGRLSYHRRSMRLKGYDYSNSGAYFVTVVTEGRRAYFGRVEDGAMRLSPAGTDS